MTNDMWGMLGDQLAKAQAQQTRNPHLCGGFHVLKITQCEINKRTRNHGDATIVELEQVATSGKGGLGARSWYQGSKQHADAYFAAVKGFILAVLNAHPDLLAWFCDSLSLGPIEMWQGQQWAQAVAAINNGAFNDRIIACWSRPKTTRQGKLILDHRFEAAPQNAWPVFDPNNPPPDVPEYAPQPAPHYAPQPVAAPVHYAPQPAPVHYAPQPAPHYAPQPVAAPVHYAPQPVAAPVAPPPPPAWGAAPPPPPPAPPAAPPAPPAWGAAPPPPPPAAAPVAPPPPPVAAPVAPPPPPAWGAAPPPQR